MKTSGVIGAAVPAKGQFFIANRSLLRNITLGPGIGGSKTWRQETTQRLKRRWEYNITMDYNKIR
jgi:hypothetical protein